MAEDTTAFVIPLHQAPLRKKKDRTGAKRAKAYGQGKKQVAKAKVIAPAETEPSASESLIPPEFLPVDSPIAEPSVTEPPPVTPHDPATQPAVTIHPAITSSRCNVAALTTAALALGAVGITINSWFARSLGASDMAGWLFLAVGVAADLLRRTFTCLRSLTTATSLKHVKNVVLVPPADRFFAASYLLRPHWLGHIAL